MNTYTTNGTHTASYHTHDTDRTPAYLAMQDAALCREAAYQRYLQVRNRTTLDATRCLAFNQWMEACDTEHAAIAAFLASAR